MKLYIYRRQMTKLFQLLGNEPILCDYSDINLEGHSKISEIIIIESVDSISRDDPNTPNV